MATFDLFKKIGFVLLIVLVFTPLTFLVTNTIVENYIVTEETSDCYLKYVPYPETLNKTESILQQQQMKECEDANMLIIENQETYKFTIIALINIVVILTLLIFGKKLDEVIYYSLFFGAGLNTISIVMRYGQMNSLVGAILGIFMFILIITFINKVLKKDKLNQKPAKK
jgi:hypothetical protein